MSFLRTLSSPLKPFLTTRAFTTTACNMAPKQEWLVILPDYTGKLAERNSVRAYVTSSNLPPTKRNEPQGCTTPRKLSHKQTANSSLSFLPAVTTSSTPPQTYPPA
jgi:hypothetical protein